MINYYRMSKRSARLRESINRHERSFFNFFQGPYTEPGIVSTVKKYTRTVRILLQKAPFQIAIVVNYEPSIDYDPFVQSS